MFATAKKMIGLAALVGVGFIVADDFALGSSAVPPVEVTKTADRYPGLAGTPSARIAMAMQAVSFSTDLPDAGKGNRMSATDGVSNCAEETWPRIAPECLLSVNATARKSIRTITVERQIGANSSVLERKPAL